MPFFLVCILRLSLEIPHSLFVGFSSAIYLFTRSVFSFDRVFLNVMSDDLGDGG
jgi:hypothetical protein